MVPAFHTGIFPSIGKIMLELHHEIQSFIERDIGHAAQRRLLAIKLLLCAPPFLDFIRCYDADLSYLPTKEGILHYLNAYDHGTVHKMVLEVIGQNLFIGSAVFPYHLLVRFMDAGEAEFALVTLFQYFLDTVKLKRGGDMFTIFVRCPFSSFETSFWVILVV
jgi:hypothetical protein